MSSFARNSLLFHGTFGRKQKKNRNDLSARKRAVDGGGINRTSNPTQTPLRSNVGHSFNGNVNLNETAQGRQGVLAEESEYRGSTTRLQVAPPPAYNQVHQPRRTPHHEPDFGNDNACLSQLTMSQFSSGSQDYSSRSSSSQPASTHQNHHNIHSVNSNSSTTESLGSYTSRNNHFSMNQERPTKSTGNSWNGPPNSSSGSIGGPSIRNHNNNMTQTRRWNFAQPARSSHAQPTTPARRPAYNHVATPRLWMTSAMNLLKPSFRVSSRPQASVEETDDEASKTDSSAESNDKTPPKEARDEGPEKGQNSHRSWMSSTDNAAFIGTKCVKDVGDTDFSDSNAVSPGSRSQSRFDIDELVSCEQRIKEERQALEKLSFSVGEQIDKFRALKEETKSTMEQQKETAQMLKKQQKEAEQRIKEQQQETEQKIKEQQAALESLSSSVEMQLQELGSVTNTRPVLMQELEKVKEAQLAVLNQETDAAVARISGAGEAARVNALAELREVLMQELEKATESKFAALKEEADVTLARISETEEAARVKAIEGLRDIANLSPSQSHLLQAILPAIRDAASHAATELAQKEAQRAFDELDKIASAGNARPSSITMESNKKCLTLSSSECNAGAPSILPSPTEASPVLEPSQETTPLTTPRSRSTLQVQTKSATQGSESLNASNDGRDESATKVVPDQVNSSFIPRFLRTAGSLVTRKAPVLSPPRTRSGKKRVEPSRPVSRRSKRKKVSSGALNGPANASVTVTRDRSAKKGTTELFSLGAGTLEATVVKPALLLPSVSKNATQPLKAARRGKRSKIQSRALMQPRQNICITPPINTQTFDQSSENNELDATDDEWGCGASRSLFVSPVAAKENAKARSKENVIPVSSISFKSSTKYSRKRKTKPARSYPKKNRGSMGAFGMDNTDFSFM